MSADLSRWNRAGLRRFVYVNGNAATYLQDVVQALATSFQPWGDGELAPWLAGSGGTPSQAHTQTQTQSQTQRWQRAAQAYAKLQGAPGSPALEIARSFARACHVLGSAVNAHANEGFIGTATQWEHLRRMAQMLDHAPRPPASASTPLVLQVKPGMGGTLRRGFKVKHSPAEGAPVAFETLEDLALVPALNTLHLHGHARSSTPLASTDTLVLDGVVEDVRVGDVVVLEHTGAAAADDASALRPGLVAGVSAVGGHTEIRLASRLALPTATPWRLGDVRVHLNPTDRLQVLGPAQGGQPPSDTDCSLVLQDKPQGLKAGQVVFIGSGQRGIFARVLRVQDRRLTLDRAPAAALPDTPRAELRVGLARSVAISRQIPDDGHRLAMPLALRLAGDWRGLADSLVAHGSRRTGHFALCTLQVTLARYYPVGPEPAPRQGHTDLLLQALPGQEAPDNPQSLLVPPESLPWRVDCFLRNDLVNEQPFSHTLHTTRAKKLGRGDLCAVVMGRRVTAGRVADLSLLGTGSRLVAQGWSRCPGQGFYLQQTALQGHFAVQARLAGWGRNDSVVAGTQLTLDTLPQTDAQASPQAVAQALAPGRRLVVEALGANGQPLHCTSAGVVAAEVGADGLVHLQIDTELPAGPYTASNTVVHGNVVWAGHGEAQPTAVLGSGDATASGQSFVFPHDDVAFVADATQTSGVRADLTLSIGGETWLQVPTLHYASATAAQYTVRVTEEGFLRLGFGDGVRGRRLPSGDNNLRVAWRRGHGSVGNLPAACLTQPEHPDPRLAGVRQPLDSTGGNETEGVVELRRSAPASLRTLGRAVSLVDFENLAMSQSSVWQARAFRGRQRAHQTGVSLVVVPAHGGALGGLRQDLALFISAHALPGVAVELLDYRPLPLQLNVVLGIDLQRFDAQAVAAQVRQALQAALQLRHRRIGERLYLSEVVRTVEDTPGVEYSTCRFVQGGALQASQWLDPAGRDGLIHLDPAARGLVITVEQATR